MTTAAGAGLPHQGLLAGRHPDPRLRAAVRRATGTDAYGAADITSDFTIGRNQVVLADANSHSLVVQQDGVRPAGGWADLPDLPAERRSRAGRPAKSLDDTGV